MQTITPFLWFDDQAEEAVEFYTSIFEDARIVEVSRYGEDGPGPTGTVMTATFELAGQRFIALNGGPAFTFNESISFMVSCDSQAEVDSYWSKLCDGGEEGRCGWLKDRFGVSWQVVPTRLSELLGDPDPAAAKRVMHAMLQMNKIDIATLERARAGA